MKNKIINLSLLALFSLVAFCSLCFGKQQMNDQIQQEIIKEKSKGNGKKKDKLIDNKISVSEQSKPNEKQKKGKTDNMDKFTK